MITERTGVSLSVLLIVVGFVATASVVFFQARAASSGVENLEPRVTTLEVEKKAEKEAMMNLLQRVESHMNEQDKVMKAVEKHVAVDESAWVNGRPSR